MTFVTLSRGARLSAGAGACVVLLAVILTWLNATSDRATSVPQSEVVVGSTVRDGWKTVEYRGVEVDVPSAWERVDMSDCEFQFERWARPDSAPCHVEGGAGFYLSATFDPAHGPGVRHTTGDDAGTPKWGGYEYAGDLAVYASDPDRQLVQQVLDSARVTER